MYTMYMNEYMTISFHFSEREFVGTTMPHLQRIYSNTVINVKKKYPSTQVTSEDVLTYLIEKDKIKKRERRDLQMLFNDYRELK